MSTREMVLSPQFGTHTLPKPAASPEHGRFPTVTAAATAFVLTSNRCTEFFGPFDTQIASSVTTCQSGVPSTGNTASGWISLMSRFTPGVETPGGGGRLGRVFFVLSGCAPVCAGGSCAHIIHAQAPREMAKKRDFIYACFLAPIPPALPLPAADRSATTCLPSDCSAKSR